MAAGAGFETTTLRSKGLVSTQRPLHNKRILDTLGFDSTNAPPCPTVLFYEEALKLTTKSNDEIEAQKGQKADTASWISLTVYFKTRLMK